MYEPRGAVSQLQLAKGEVAVIPRETLGSNPKPATSYLIDDYPVPKLFDEGTGGFAHATAM
jgi:hypothetical protein